MNQRSKMIQTILALSLTCSGCATTLHFQPPQVVAQAVQERAPRKVLVADMGTFSQKRDDHLGWSQTFWLPIHWRAEDRSDQPIILHRWISESLVADLEARGYSAMIAPRVGSFLNEQEAFDAARGEGAERVVLVKLRRLGSFTGGYLLIPLVSIMSARLEIDYAVYEPTGAKLSEKTFAQRHISPKGWKVLILDSPFDAIWGRRWFQKEYAERLLPAAITEIESALAASWKPSASESANQ